MKRLTLSLIAAAALAITATGCESSTWATSNRHVAQEILRTVEPMCAPYGGIGNIMLMEKATDDGIVTCRDGRHNFPFDA